MSTVTMPALNGGRNTSNVTALPAIVGGLRLAHLKAGQHVTVDIDRGEDWPPKTLRGAYLGVETRDSGEQFIGVQEIAGPMPLLTMIPVSLVLTISRAAVAA